MLLTLVSAIGSACAVLQAPVAPPAPNPQGRYHLSGEGFEIDAEPIRTWEQNWELFDDNLPEIGLLAVWVEMRGTSTREIDMTRAKWELRRGVEKFRLMRLDSLYKQYYKRHNTRLYSVRADANAREAMGTWLFNADRLRSSESRKGFLFFQAASAQSPDWNRGSVLVVSGLAEEGGGRAGRRLELPLFHAHP